METAVPRDRRTEFNFTLTGYRGLCALLVFAFHLGSAGVVGWPGGTPAKDLAYDFWTSLSFGVDMFFMISGFVLALPFATRYLAHGPRVSLRSYFLRRLTRLEPA